MDDSEEHAADKEAAGNVERDYCYYPACDQWAKPDGLCMKHLVAAAKGDKDAVAVKQRRGRLAEIKEEAAKIVRANHAVEEQVNHKAHKEHEGEAETQHTPAAGVGESPAKTPGQPGDRSKPMAATEKCDLCGRDIDMRGFSRHRKACDGKAPTTALCGVDGCIRKAGHDGQHYGRTKTAAPRTGTPASMKKAPMRRSSKTAADAPAGITIAAEAPAAIAARTRELAEALGLIVMPGIAADGIGLFNPGPNALAVVGFDGTIRRGAITFEQAGA